MEQNQENSPGVTAQVDKALNDKMAKAAMKQLGALCIGNGVSKKDLKLLKFNGAIAHVVACVEIHPEIDAKIHEKRGRVKGDQMFESREAMNSALESLKESLSEKQDLMEKVAKTVLNRKDKGIVGQPEALSLKTLNQSFVCLNPCQSCNGSGKNGCPKCHGKTAIQCMRCHGERRVLCAVCQGKTTISGPDGGQKPCPRCQSQGRVNCDYCKGQGKIPCPQCNNTGSIKCRNCDGHGVYSSVAQIQIQARIECHFDTNELGEDFTQHLRKHSQHLLTKKIAKLKSDGGAPKIDLNQGNVPSITHNLSVPIAELELQFGKKRLSLEMMGYQPQFLDMPPLLDGALSKAVKFAASTKARLSPGQSLQTLGRYKIFRQAMALVAGKSVNSAARSLKAKYGMIASEELIQNIALQVNILMNKATKAPLRNATIFTSLTMATFFGTYFVGPGQAQLADIMAGQPTLSNFKDWGSWIILGIAIILTIPLHQGASKIFFKSRLGKLIPAEYAILLLQRISKFKWRPLLWTVFVFLVLYVPLEVLGLRLADFGL